MDFICMSFSHPNIYVNTLANSTTIQLATTTIF